MRRHHRTTAVLGRDSPPSTHTAWMESAGFERLDVLDAHVVLPTIDEVVLVKETLMEAEPEIARRTQRGSRRLSARCSCP